MDALPHGTAALAAGDWSTAREAFEASLADEETPEGHDGLARALWWTGAPDRAIEHRERAFALWRGSGDRERAGATAVWLAREHLAVYGEDAVANGWLARAERLLADADGAARGRLELARGRRAADPRERGRRAEIALAAARAADDVDLEVAALAELGLVAIQTDRVVEGLDLLDEAMAAATGGETDLLETVAETCCSLVAACDLAGDAGRLEQWARIVSSFVEQREGLPLLAFCSTCNAQMLAATGHREDAERELLVAMGELRASGHRSRCVDPAVRLAEVRLRQGRLEEASSLLDGREGLPEAALVAAEVHLARGEPTLAVARLLRRLNQVEPGGLLAAPVQARLVDARVAEGDLLEAAAVAAALTTAAEDSGHPLLIAYASLARGVVALAAADPGTAVADLEIAAERFERLDQPLEAARAREALARASAEAAPSLAAEDARRAQILFERVGADRDADRAAALVRGLGGPARTGPKDLGLLTKRETEVLALLGAGLSNAEIASRLFISTKTAGHHVSSILSKLHLRNRAEAAAFAMRGPPTIPHER